MKFNNFLDIFHCLFKVFSLCIATLKRRNIREKTSRLVFFYDSRKLVKLFGKYEKPSLGLVGYWSFDVGKGGAKAVDMSGRGETKNRDFSRHPANQ